MEFDTNRRRGRPLAREPRKAHEQLFQLVGFYVGGEEFVIDILRVQEIIRTQQLTRVPNSPEFMEGVMNLRGKIIPVIALRKRFGLEEIPPGKQNRIVAVEIQGSRLGFVVDAVSEPAALLANLQVTLPPIRQASA